MGRNNFLIFLPAFHPYGTLDGYCISRKKLADPFKKILQEMITAWYCD